MKVSRITVLFALMNVAGCTIPSGDQRRLLDSMIGRLPVDVVRTFGVPTKSFASGDRTFLAYISDTSYYNSNTYGYGYGGGWGWHHGGLRGGAWGGDFGPSYVQSECQTTFEFKDDHVISWNIHGDGC